MIKMKEIFSIQNEIISQMAQDLANKQEKLIFDKLKEMGYDFATYEEKIAFVSKRLQQRVHPEHVEIILDDNVFVTGWSKKIEITQGWNVDGTFAVTAKQ